MIFNKLDSNFICFQNSKISVKVWLKVIFYFSCDAQLYQIQKFVPEVSKKTLIGMMQKLRDICSIGVQKITNELVFGNDVEFVSNVEIDEAYFGKKRKNNKGKRFKKQWVFGITERKSNKVYFKIVENRTKATLIPLITRFISKTATLHHDDWPAYRQLSQIGYRDLIVNHTKGFKSPSGACTNTIEGIWGVVKQRISRMHGMPCFKLDAYLNEYTFRYYHKGNMLNAVLKELAYKP